MAGDSRIIIEGNLESRDYVIMTENALRQSGITWKSLPDGYEICGNQTYSSEPQIRVEGDYSSASFFLCAGALSANGITVRNLSEASGQGDRRIVEVLKKFGARIERRGDEIFAQRDSLNAITIDGSMIPDLIPVLSVVAAAARGTTHIIHAERLRMKESDRIKSTVEMLKAIGASVAETEDGMVIEGQECLTGGTVDSYMDHRIAMAAAVATGICRNPVTVINAQCVSKSYPAFWDDLESMEVDR
jgi:3-phosphoshikimate 1-carboxyvinyltransferase